MSKGFFPRLAAGGIRKNGRIYLPFLLTSILTAAMQYMMCSLKQASAPGSSLAFSLSLGMIVTTLFTVIFLFYTNSFLMKRRKREFGLYNVLGMEKRHLARVILWETLMLLAATLALGLGAGIVLDRLMHLVLTRMIGQIGSITFRVDVASIWYTALLITGAFLLILGHSVFQVFRAKPIELLHAASAGEREPKARWFIALLGLITLGGGYWLSVSIQDPATMIIMFFAAVILVIVGTYLLFTAGSIALLKLLKRNKRYYYQPRHFINVSGMLYRMKQNAVGLANICVLSTMALVMVFSTLALWLNIEDQLIKQVKYDISMDSATRTLEELQAQTDAALAEQGLTPGESRAYHYLNFATLRQGDEFVSGDSGEMNFSATPISIIVNTLDDYNRIWGHDLTLAPDEALLHPYRLTYGLDTIRVMGKPFRVKAEVADEMESDFAIASMYPTMFLVVDSLDTMRQLNELQAAAYGRNRSNLHVSYDFDLDVPEERLPEIRQAINQTVQANADDRFTTRANLMELFGGLLFVGLFLGMMFVMAMILIVYYKQITEGYEDRERYRIMRKVGLSRREIRRSISSQILMVFFLPLLASGLHVAFAFPGLVTMFRALSMNNVKLFAFCALSSFAVFGALYGVVYLLTSRVYYRIVSED